MSTNVEEAGGEGADGPKKRNRTTPEQLALLEEVFAKNTTPNAATREALAEKLDMTPRSVQIWFQNRRAKVKLLDRKSHQKAEAMLAMGYPYLTQQAAQRLSLGARPLHISQTSLPVFADGYAIRPFSLRLISYPFLVQPRGRGTLPDDTHVFAQCCPTIWLDGSSRCPYIFIYGCRCFGCCRRRCRGCCSAYGHFFLFTD